MDFLRGAVSGRIVSSLTAGMFVLAACGPAAQQAAPTSAPAAPTTAAAATSAPAAAAQPTAAAKTGDVAAQYAERWEFAGDCKTLSFVMRDGLKWSDGSPITGYDFKFTVMA